MIRAATPADAEAVSRLVQASFCVHVAPDWAAEAQDNFFRETTPELLAGRLADCSFAAVHEEHGRIGGVILLPRPTLVQLCFVAPEQLRRGIGSALWEAARAHLEVHCPDVKTVELNASPYAVAAYQAMGFYPISKALRRRGAVSTRMACWLPGRALERAAGPA